MNNFDASFVLELRSSGVTFLL